MELRHDTSVTVLNVTADPCSLLLGGAGTGFFYSVATPSVSQSEAEQKAAAGGGKKKPTTSTKLLMTNEISKRTAVHA